MKKLVGIMLVALGLFSSAGVRADPIGGSSCGSCFGTTIALEFQTVTPTNWLVHLFINTAGYNGPGSLAAWIGSVAIKPASQVTGGSLANPTPPGVWAFQLGGLNNGGCDGTGSGFLCAQSSSHLALTNGSTYEWIFNVTVANANQWLTGPMAASVKANFGPANGIITSENITLQQCTTTPCGGPPNEIPEPQTLALLGLGLFGLALARRKYRA